MKMRISPASIVVVIVSLLALAIGCGGSGGSGGGIAAPTGTEAVRSASIAGYQSLGAGSALPYVAVQVAAPKGSTLALAARLSKPTRGLEYIPQLNLYTPGPVLSGDTGTVQYYSDSAGTTSAGSMKLTTTGGFAYASYPATVTVSVNMTAGYIPCKGQFSITYTDSSGANTVAGNLALTRNSETLSLNLSLSAGLEVSGSLTITENGTTINATNFYGPVGGTANFDFTTSPQGDSGTGTMSLSTAAFTLNFGDPSLSTCKEDSAGDLVITYSDGKSETISNPFEAVLLGGDGGTTGTTTGTGGTAGTGTTSGTGGTTGTPPYTLGIVAGTKAAVSSVSPGGQMVGTSGTTQVPTYWSSPSAQPQAITLDSTVTGTFPDAVDSSGQIVGIGQSATGGPVLLYWSAYNSKPVHMFVPPQILATQANTLLIQSSGRIFASLVNVSQSTEVTYVYSSYTDTNPYQLTGGYVSAVSDGAAVLGVSTSGASVVWPQTTATSTPILVPEANSPSLKYVAMGANGTLAVTDAGAETITYVPGPSYRTQTVLKTPTGDPSATGVGPTGHVLGTVMTGTSGTTNDGLIWTSPTGSPIVLRSTATPGVVAPIFETTSGVLVVNTYNAAGTFQLGYMTPK